MGSYFLAATLSLARLAVPYVARGFWSLELSPMYIRGTYDPRVVPDDFHSSPTAMTGSRTAASWDADDQSMTVVHPESVSWDSSRAKNDSYIVVRCLPFQERFHL